MYSLTRKHKLLITLTGLALGALGMHAGAQDAYPNRPITLVAAFAAGGGTDVIARYVAQELSKELGQTVVVTNVPGAAGVIGTQQVARAKPDGYTLLLGAQSTAGTVPAMRLKMPFDPIKDLMPIVYLMSQPNVFVVNPALGVKTMADFVKLAKTRPGVMNYSTSGVGSWGHFATEQLFADLGIKLTHVPYSGTNEALLAVVKGDVQALFSSIPVAIPHLNNSAIVPLGVSSSTRVPFLPGVPPLADLVPGYNMGPWNGIWGPANMPDNVVEALVRASRKMLNNESMRKFAEDKGSTLINMSRDEFIRFIDKDAESWRKMVVTAGIERM